MQEPEHLAASTKSICPFNAEKAQEAFEWPNEWPALAEAFDNETFDASIIEWQAVHGQVNEKGTREESTTAVWQREFRKGFACNPISCISLYSGQKAAIT